ncbi:hypothetical protein ESCO_002017 [Escovopsis weberi]|uniref:Extracellular membrane protein CFEM domain-containing protein n=1 Tax=Escovopsis weberi TaxID=150374 RepID=A0A0M8MYD5_ESCWE|nr:hypothetical protein ESCO_002017 [Escovopsis weberi]
MRFSGATALLLGSGALAKDLMPCLATKAAQLAQDSGCADQPSLLECLAHVSGTNAPEVATCLRDAGCIVGGAAAEAALSIFRDCTSPGSSGSRSSAVQKRSRDSATLPQQTPQLAVHAAHDAANNLAAMPTPAAAHGLAERDGTLQCLITETVSTHTCSVETKGNRLKTISCYETQVAKSRCAPGLMCSMDPTGADVCMKMHNTLDVGGIIISIIFGVSIVIGVSALTFMSCKERSYQKKLEARAEATALARAQTKKQRAEQRSPLMRQGEGGGDPFHDRNRS